MTINVASVVDFKVVSANGLVYSLFLSFVLLSSFLVEQRGCGGLELHAMTSVPLDHKEQTGQTKKIYAQRPKRGKELVGGRSNNKT